jgi:hypothetical protein
VVGLSPSENKPVLMDYSERTGTGMNPGSFTCSLDTAIYCLANFLNCMKNDAAILFSAGKLRAVAGQNRTRENSEAPVKFAGLLAGCGGF